MIERLVTKLFTVEVMGICLIVAALQILVYGVASSLNNPDTTYLSVASFIAVGLGLGLGKRNLKPIPASAGMAALGVAGVWILGARLSVPLINLIKAFLAVIPPVFSQLISQIIFTIQTRILYSETVTDARPVTSVDTGAITNTWLVIVEACSTLGMRFQNWFIGLRQNINGNDVLVRNMIWLFLLWLIAAWMGWFAARRNAITALLPGMILLAIITDYTAQKTGIICGMVVILLLLMGVWNYKNNIQFWEKHKVDYAESIRYDSTQVVLVLTLIIGTLAFITPSISWREIRNAWRERQQTKNEMADALGIQQQAAAPGKVAVQTPTLPRDHLLGGEVANSKEIVMTIRTGELPPIPMQATSIAAPRYYWRSVTYDDYVGAGWVTTRFIPQQYAANTPLIPGLLNGYKLLHLDVQLMEPNGQLFWSGILFSADALIKAEWRLKPTSNLFADQETLLQADMFAVTTSATAYHAETYVPNVSIAELNAASTDYPEEIRNHYLQLPATVPERVLNLAKQITAGESTPYDEAKAIETYLRTNYPYDTNVPKPPPDQDAADYFLFDLKKGYCDYYATAMVVLVRASGVPARFVSGYAPGEYDAPNARYIIRELDAHSWVEVYFPDIGWIEFEPTSSIPEIVREKQNDLVTPVSKSNTLLSNLLLRMRLMHVSYFVVPILIILFGSLLYLTWIEKWRYTRLAPAVAIEKIYRRLYRAGRPLAGKWTHAETSKEFTEKLIGTLNQKQETQVRFNRLFIKAQKEVALLTEVYHSVLFRDIPTQKKDVLIAWHAWRNLRWRLWFTRIASINLKRKFNSLPLIRLFTVQHGDK